MTGARSEAVSGDWEELVYAACSYDDGVRPAHTKLRGPADPDAHLYAKIVQLSYDPATGIESIPVALIDGLPTGSDHNSGRIKFVPDGKLHYTIGDIWNDQLGNWCIPIVDQRLPTADEIAAQEYFAYQGKSLRLNPDGSIPADNPVLKGIQSHSFVYGHTALCKGSFWP
ncbi:MAG: PQQ-dependent sugar dehydrogenase [Rhodobacterales bacterium]|nr:PQQ-dependent sugar dehydrogenase [Rhodobacterales bacterium]